jgi:hypothetical protein
MFERIKMNEMNMTRDELIMDDKDTLESTIVKQQDQIERLTSANEAMKKTAIKQNRTIVRMLDVMNEMINKLLRQTIAMKTHGERNQDIRRWASELIQILSIADDESGMDDIPF